MDTPRVRHPGSTIGFYFAGLSKEETNAVRARLNAIAAELGYRASRGATAGQGNAAALLVAIAAGEVQVMPTDHARHAPEVSIPSSE